MMVGRVRNRIQVTLIHYVLGHITLHIPGLMIVWIWTTNNFTQSLSRKRSFQHNFELGTSYCHKSHLVLYHACIKLLGTWHVIEMGIKTIFRWWLDFIGTLWVTRLLIGGCHNLWPPIVDIMRNFKLRTFWLILRMDHPSHWHWRWFIG